jgi:hypothetical protein
VDLREVGSESVEHHQMMIAAVKWVLLTIVFIGKDKMKWGEVKSFTHI